MKEPIQVRVVGPDEWSVWRELRMQALSDAPDSFADTLDAAQRRSKAEWSEYFSSIFLGGGTPLVADCEEVPVGIAAVGTVPDELRSSGILGMWVVPTAREQGVGRALLEPGIEQSERLEVDEIRLSVTEGNDRAKRLYLRAGFKDTGRRRRLRADSTLKLESMTKRLSI